MLATESMLWTVDDIPLLDDFPEGYRYEASEGVLEVTPPPELGHEFTAELLQDQLRAQLPAQWRVSTGLAVRTKTGFRVPDLVVRMAATRQPGTARWIPADEVAVAVEVESPTGLRRDRETKRDEYDEIGIASYWRVGAATDARGRCVRARWRLIP